MTFGRRTSFSTLAALALASATASQAQTTPAAIAFTTGVSHDKRHITYTVERDGTYVKDVELIRLVENDAGVRAEGQQTVPYSASLQALEIVHARVITAKGETIEVPAASILDQQPYLSQGAPAFSDVVSKAIVFPQVSPGARTSVHYRITQKKPLLQGHFSAIEYASVHDVRRDVTYTVIAPADMPMQVTGIDFPIVKTTLPDGRIQWRAHTTNTVAVPHDVGSVATGDYSQRFVATSVPSGEALAQAYRSLAGERSQPTPQVKALAQSLTQGINDPEEQTRALYDWVRINIRYVAIFLERGGWQPHAVDDILSAGYGDCKDKATLLSALLEAKGIASTPVLINAGNSYWMPEVPVPQAFNHMITYVPSLNLYLDATDRWAPFGVLSPGDTNKRVLHLVDGSWNDTPSPAFTAMLRHRVSTAADSRVTGHLELTGTGAQQVGLGQALAAMQSIPDVTLMAPLLSQMQVKGEGRLQRPSPEVRGPVSLVIDYWGVGPMDLPGPGAVRLPASPFMLVPLPIAMYQTPRRFPFVCPTTALREEFDLEFPATLKVLRNFAPLELESQSEGARLRYRASTRQDGARIVVTREFTAERLKTLCTPDDQRRWQPLIEAAQRNMRSQMLYE